MDYLHNDLGHLAQGAAITVELTGNACNVMLVDDLNYGRYRRGERYGYHGGHVTRSPIVLYAPSAGRWHLVIDLGGRGGRIGAVVRVAA